MAKRKSLSIAEARASLAALVHQVEAGAPVTLTRRGKPVAVLLSLERYQRLEGTAGNFWDAIQQFRHDHTGEDLHFAFEGLRDGDPGREVTL